MPFIPHSDDDIREMLATIGASSIEELFDEIPDNLRHDKLANVPEGLSEMEVTQLAASRAREDGQPLCFIGAGAYDHHIPAAVWQIATRGEFYSAYTPYQAEASQGTLQLLYEYQSMMTALTAMDVSNASLYDGASALAEAILMAVRANRKSKSKTVLVPRALHPAYRKTAEAIVRNQGITLVELPFDDDTGQTDLAALTAYREQDITAIVIAQPNFFGVLEAVDELTEWAHDTKALSIAVANPLALSVLTPPGEWGAEGVDICVGEGQPLGVPLASGGPCFGFMCCRQSIVRQMPGRIIGRTVDLDGKTGFTLTLQAREQHIRRSKATSNICTNQGLLVTAATIHMAIMGAEGLARTASACHENLNRLTERYLNVPDVASRFSGAVFHERVIRLPIPAAELLKLLSAYNILGGHDLGNDYPELENCLLVCATEKRGEQDIDAYITKAERILGLRSEAKCPVQPKF